MGSDPRRLDGLRADEQVAARLVERATGATARAHDIGRRQGAYDVHLTYPDGRTAALEVTTHAGTASRNGLVLLGRDRLSRGARGRRARAVDTDARPALRPDPGHPRRTEAAPDATADPHDQALAALPTAVSDLLVEPHVARRAAKVAGAGRVDERHLFVGVAEGGLPPEVYQRLSDPLDALPPDPPQVPDGLTHLWLTTEWRGSPLLGWDARGGWAAYQV